LITCLFLYANWSKLLLIERTYMRVCGKKTTTMTAQCNNGNRHRNRNSRQTTRCHLRTSRRPFSDPQKKTKSTFQNSRCPSFVYRHRKSSLYI